MQSRPKGMRCNMLIVGLTLGQALMRKVDDTNDSNTSGSKTHCTSMSLDAKQYCYYSECGECLNAKGSAQYMDARAV